jgi:hypothetical protein
VPFIAGMPDARGINVKVARLRVFEKRGRDARRQRIGLDDDRFGVIRNEDSENAPEKLPGRFTRFDGADRRLFERRIDEAVPGAYGREDPRAKPALLALRQRDPADPARIDLQLLAWLAIEHRDRRGGFPKLQLQDREAVQRGIRNRDPLPNEEFANLGEAEAVAEPPLDRGPLLETPRPAVAARAPTGGMQREQDLTDLLIADRRRHTDAGGRGGREIPADGFRIEPKLGGDPLLRQALASEPKDFPDFDHGDLAIHPRLLVPGRGPGPETSIARSGERGERF